MYWKLAGLLSRSWVSVFEEGKYFIPDLLMSGEIMENISNIVKPHISAETEEKSVERCL